jgi:hypothetical protein
VAAVPEVPLHKLKKNLQKNTVHGLKQDRGMGIEVFNQMKSQAVEHPEMSHSQIIRNRL